MKSKNGPVWVLIVIGVAVLALVIAGYFIFKPRGLSTRPEQPIDPSSTTTVSNEDGTHEGYIKRTFLEDDKKFIDVDYI